MSGWLRVHRGTVPLVVAFPHGGTGIPAEFADSFTSPWLARKDADWWIDRLYAFVEAMGATTIRTGVSRSVIDCNRDPSGASLYPGQATTDLCPTETFDGEPLYLGAGPSRAETERRRAAWFDPYHAALAGELERLRAENPRVVLYDAHSIRSRIPRLFDGELPQFNIGTNGGVTCSAMLARSWRAMNTVSFISHSHLRNGNAASPSCATNALPATCAKAGMSSQLT